MFSIFIIRYVNHQSPLSPENINVSEFREIVIQVHTKYEIHSTHQRVHVTSALRKLHNEIYTSRGNRKQFRRSHVCSDCNWNNYWAFVWRFRNQ